MVRTGRNQKQLIKDNSLKSLDFLYRLGKLLPINHGGRNDGKKNESPRQIIQKRSFSG